MQKITQSDFEILREKFCHNLEFKLFTEAIEDKLDEIELVRKDGEILNTKLQPELYFIISDALIKTFKSYNNGLKEL
tara:strand:- start:2990 stop:3220 length:231 start_codon:yes stop_codon:yes gene_type:complete